MNNNLYQDSADEIANYQFQKSFFAKYESSRLEFCSNSLQHCLRQITLERKPLVFFLHKENDPFSQKCCDILTEKDVEDLIVENFSLMGWDINNEDENFSSALERKILIVEEVIEYIRNRKSCIFIIMPYNSTVKVVKIIKNIVDKNSLLSPLNKILRLLSLYITQDYFKNMTSDKYQQWMYEELSDRDYDSFEPDQHHLFKNKILYAMHGPPRELQNETIGYEEKQIKEMNKIYDKIRSKNNEYSKWNDRIVIAFIYNCLEPTETNKKQKVKRNQDYKPEEDFSPVPIFVLRKCKIRKDQEGKIKNPCCIFIDTDCRVYDTWENYLKNNKLPPHKMKSPVNGKYQTKNDSDDVWLDEKLSPSCSKLTKFLKVTDTGNTVVSILSGATLVAAMFTPLAVVAIPVALATSISTGLYAVGRNAGTLVDRGIHEQSIDIKNSENRATYLNMAAGVTGAASAGTTQILGIFAGSGASIGTGVRSTADAISGANVIISGTAAVNSCYDVVQKYIKEEEKSRTLRLIQLDSSLFFFENSVANFRMEDSVINEVDTSTLNEILEAVQSNQYRKVFNKLLEEAKTAHDSSNGRPTVIATVRNSATTQQEINVENYSMPTAFNVASVSDFNATINALTVFTQDVQHKIIKIYDVFVCEMDIEFIQDLQELFIRDVKDQIIKYIVNFIRKHAANIKNVFESRLLNENVKTVCGDFSFENPQVNIDNFIKHVVDKFLDDIEMMNTLKHEFESWYVALVYDKQQMIKRKNERRKGPIKQETKCRECGGYYYTKLH